MTWVIQRQEQLFGLGLGEGFCPETSAGDVARQGES